jgi:hypothetical protein
MEGIPPQVQFLECGGDKGQGLGWDAIEAVVRQVQMSQSNIEESLESSREIIHEKRILSDVELF